MITDRMDVVYGPNIQINKSITFKTETGEINLIFNEVRLVFDGTELFKETGKEV